MAAVIDLVEMAVEGDREEGDPDYGYVGGASIDSIFYYLKATDSIGVQFLHPEAKNEPTYREDRLTDFCCSTLSLLLALPYTVFNPFTRSRRRIMGQSHPVGTPCVLLVNMAEGGNMVFHIVCALPAVRIDERRPEGDHAYYFDVYHSDSASWHLSEDEHFLAPIKANTGIQWGTKACWLNQKSLIVSFDTADESDVSIDPPEKFQHLETDYNMQLGKRDKDLCLVVATEVELEVYIRVLKHWRILHQLQFLRRAPPVPIRFESKRLQVIFWVDQHLFILEESWRHAINGQFQIRKLPFEGPVVPESPGDCVSHINDFELSSLDDFSVMIIPSNVPHSIRRRRGTARTAAIAPR